jgi:hypothetical protein
VPLAVALGVVVVLLGVLFVAFARDPGPDPADVAIAYERAFDALDFSLLYDLSGDELRDGQRREAFVASRRAAHTGAAVRGLASGIEVESVVQSHDTSIVVTRVRSAEGGSVRNTVVLERRTGVWLVVGYSLRPETRASGP